MQRLTALALALVLAALSLTACTNGSASTETAGTNAETQTSEPASTEAETTDETPPAQPQSTAAPTAPTTAAPPADEADPIQTKTDERMTTVQTPEGSTEYAFTTASFCLHAYGGEKPFPRGTVMESAAALDAFSAENNADYYAQLLRSGNPDVEQSFEKITSRYDDAWFASHRLVVAEIEASSGSFRHTITKVTRTPDGSVLVEYERTEPEVHTCDMAYWILCIELDSTAFCGTDTVTVRRVRT